jgi:hypothetical protein
LGQTTASANVNLGFLTIIQEGGSFLGGYLVTNQWGRPLEFRLSTAVQPNRVQQVLYAGTLRPYICSDVIGKALVEKTSAAARLILTDCDAVLDLRLHVEIPVVLVGAADAVSAAVSAGRGVAIGGGQSGHLPLLQHPRFGADEAAVHGLLQPLDGVLDLKEPFLRVREAITEARKMGVTSRG